MTASTDSRAQPQSTVKQQRAFFTVKTLSISSTADINTNRPQRINLTSTTNVSNKYKKKNNNYIRYTYFYHKTIDFSKYLMYS